MAYLASWALVWVRSSQRGFFVTAFQEDPWPRFFAVLASDLLVIAIVGVLGVWLWRRLVTPDQGPWSAIVGLGWLAMVVFWVPVIIRHSSSVIDGETLFWLVDDRMISMVFARNLAEGNGLIWAQGEKVEGFGSPIWIAWMAAILAAGVPLAIAPLIVLLTSVASCMFIVALIPRAVRLLGGGVFAAASAAAALILTSFALFLTSAGWEAVPAAALTLWAFCCVVEDCRDQRPRYSTAVLIGLLPLLRFELFAVCLLLAGALLIGGRGARGAVIRALALGAIAPAAYQVFRLAYFGDWLPNTFVHQVFNWPDRQAYGLAYVVPFIKLIAPALALALIGVLRARKPAEILALAMILTVIVKTALMGGDSFGGFPLLMPIIPLLFVLAALEAERLSRLLAVRTLMLAAVIAAPGMIFPGLYLKYGAPSAEEIDNVAMARELRQLCSDGSVVAEFYAGVPFYLSGCKGVDLLGRMDRHVARQAAHPESAHPHRNKFDYDYLLGVVKPDYVVAPGPPWKNTPEGLEKLESFGWYFPTALYANDWFIRHCAPNPLPIKVWRKIFRCDWSQSESPEQKPAGDV